MIEAEVGTRRSTFVRTLLQDAWPWRVTLRVRHRATRCQSLDGLLRKARRFGIDLMRDEMRDCAARNGATSLPS